jgi:polysaccharide biosynthesis/export protein
MNKKILVLILFSITAFSCIRYKDITYMRNLGEQSGDSLFKNSVTYYKVQPSDILYIKINSIDETLNSMFSQTGLMNNSAMSNIGGFYILGNPVDADGNISLPVIGKVTVAGYTIKEIQEILQTQAEKYITDARIDVRLVSFKISVLGEVKKPGQFTIYNDKANVFEALSLAGDLTYYGNRHRLLIIRTNKNGTETIRIDLTDKNILASPEYYLQPNDILIVEPMRNTAFRLSASDYSVLISTITASLSTLVLIFSLSKKL